MGWKKALKDIRRWQSTSVRNINRWITIFYREQKQKQEHHLKQFIDKEMEKDSFIELLHTSDAKRNIESSERVSYIKRFNSLTEDEMSEILEKVFPREFTSKQLIESMYGKEKDSFTPSEWNDIYHTSIRYFGKERNNMKYLLESFWTDEVYQKYIENGHTDSELFSKFILTCSEYGVYPIYCDVDGYYKLLDLDHYVNLLKKRTSAIATELRRKADVVKTIEEKGIDLHLPAVDGDFTKTITSGGSPYETLKFPLPPPKEKEVFICPFDTCKRKFLAKETLQRHLIHTHKARDKL